MTASCRPGWCRRPRGSAARPSGSRRCTGRGAWWRDRNVDELVEEGLASFLGDLQDGVRDVAVCVATEFFRHGQPSTPAHGGDRLMRFDISYVTRFTYEHDVAESQNELRAAPTADDRQQVVHYDVRTCRARGCSATPTTGARASTRSACVPPTVSWSSWPTPPSRPPPRTCWPPRPASPRFADLTPAFLDEHLEYLERSTHADWGDAIAAEVWKAREGVCQDFAHLLIAMCPTGGVPARYVSGYLFTKDDATGEEVSGDRVTVQTHAWVEVAVPGYGWWGLDPTNRQQVGERHVKIGHGRDYDDVAPLRGVYDGNADHRLDVAVDMRRAAIEAQVQQQQQ